MSTLYLLPCGISDAPLSTVLPPRNIEVARSLRHFIVENVRTARRFLKRCDPAIVIDELTFAVLNVDTRPADVAAMLAPLDAGNDMGVISEAGCPAVADPGALAVDAARAKGHNIVPLVGPSSILLALMASGFNGQSFAFRGYLPIDDAARAAELRRLERIIHADDQTQIFIETPYRNTRMLQSIIRTLPPRMRLCVASDVTGASESIRTMPLAQWAKRTEPLPKVPTIFLLYR